MGDIGSIIIIVIVFRVIFLVISAWWRGDSRNDFRRDRQPVWQIAKLLFFDVVRPPELLQFVDDVIPIFHGERTFTPHHYCHSDVVVGATGICVPNAVMLFLYILVLLQCTFYQMMTPIRVLTELLLFQIAFLV